MNNQQLAEQIRAHCQDLADGVAEVLDWYRNADDLAAARELDDLLVVHAESLIAHLGLEEPEPTDEEVIERLAESVAADTSATELNPPQRVPEKKEEPDPADGGAGNGDKSIPAASNEAKKINTSPLKQNGDARPKTTAKNTVAQLRDRLFQALDVGGVPYAKISEKSGVSEPTVRNFVAGSTPQEATMQKLSMGLDAFGY